MELQILNSQQLLDKIILSLDKKKPLSVVSVGSTESYVMAQYEVLTEEQFMSHKEAIATNKGSTLRGFTFPNVLLRDQMVNAVRKADIVGYNMLIRKMKAGLMTEMVFEAYNIQPKVLYDSMIRRVIVFSQKERFKDMLRNRKIVLIGRKAKEIEGALSQMVSRTLPFKIVKSIAMHSFNEMEEVKKKLDQMEYDLVLISAGVNAVILAPYIATAHGKVAFDIGQGLHSIITGDVVNSGFVKSIGIENLMKL